MAVLEEQVVEMPPEKAEIEIPEIRIFTLYEVPLEDDFQVWLQETCGEYGIDCGVMLAMAEQESNFDPEGVGEEGELGMWQIKPSTAAEAEEKEGRRLNLFKPEDNAKAAVILLSGYVEKYGTMEKALMAYNMGETAARRCWKNGVTGSKYAVSVMEKAERYEEKKYNRVVIGDV